MVAVLHDAAHKQQRGIGQMMQDVARRVGGFIGSIGHALGGTGGTGSFHFRRHGLAVQRDAVVHRADVQPQCSKAVHAGGQVEELLVGLHRAALGKIRQVGVGVADGDVGAQQGVGRHRVERLRVGVGVGLVGGEEKALAQHGGGNIALCQRLYPEIDLALRGAARVGYVIV